MEDAQLSRDPNNNPPPQKQQPRNSSAQTTAKSYGAVDNTKGHQTSQLTVSEM
jgi:hypothetical protein